LETPIQLIVGLGNPGPQYENTRHNVGYWFVEAVAEKFDVYLNAKAKFHGLTAKITLNDRDCWLLLPTTYMNESGRAVQAIANFYDIKPESILVVHDDLDFEPGEIKHKIGGGHGGHNGLRDIIATIGSDFNRLRIGIGHPGHKDAVTDYVLSKPSKKEKEKIEEAIVGRVKWVLNAA